MKQKPNQQQVLQNMLLETQIKFYLSKVQAGSIQELTVSQTDELFILSVFDFLRGELSMDFLSKIASITLSASSDRKLITDEEFELEHALESCSQLNTYVRRMHEFEEPHFNNCMNDVMGHYSKRKELVLPKTDFDLEEAVNRENMFLSSVDIKSEPPQD